MHTNFISIALVGLIAGTVSAFGRTIYVSPAGNNQGTGSEASPYKTLSRAYQIATSGDAIALGAGTYTDISVMTKPLTLSSWNGTAIVALPSNRPPIISAGPDARIPGVTASLVGTASDDGLPNPPGQVSVQWQQVSGAGMAAFETAGNLATRVTVSTYGTYVFRLSGNDGVFTASDDVAVTFGEGGGSNLAPTVNIPPVPTVVLPGTALLSAAVSDDGKPNPPGRLTLTWSKVSGPGAVTFNPPNAANAEANFAATGDYVLRLTVSDGEKASSDTIAVSVVNQTPANQAPIPNAGPDQSVLLSRGASLTGTVRDDGYPNPPHRVTTTWSKMSGPGTVSFGSASSLVITARFSAAGTYVLGLRADDSALQRTDTVVITVEGNAAPSVNAGADQSIDLPDTAFLDGRATDDGHPSQPGRLTISWNKIRGPGNVSFGNATQPSTTARFSLPGIYILQLAANDGDRSASNTVQITVREAMDYLTTYENGQIRCGNFGHELRIKNSHTRKSISYIMTLRLSTVFQGDFDQVLRGVLAPGESRAFACSDRSAGPGYGYVSHRITSASFSSAASQAVLAASEAVLGPELTYGISSNQFLLSWPNVVKDAVLEMAEGVGSEMRWDPVLAPIARDEDRNIVVLPPDQAHRIFRLKLP